MPRFKEPMSLQELASDSIVEHMVGYCDALSVKNRSTKLRRIVALFRQYLRDNATDMQFADICGKFLATFFSIGCKRWRDARAEFARRTRDTPKPVLDTYADVLALVSMGMKHRPPKHCRAALEIMMDVEVVGLTLEGQICHYLYPRDAHRIQGIREINWTDLSNINDPPRGLEKYRLQDLVKLVIPLVCTNHHLKIIGARCLRLETLIIVGSKKVTDKGLRALRLCSELRIVDINRCSVSNAAVNEMLNCHKKLEQFNVDTDYPYKDGKKSFALLSRPISLVCPSMRRFALKPDRVTNIYLFSIVVLFPNLTYLEFCRPFTGDLRILKDLERLEELKFGPYSGGFTIDNLKELLTSIGTNISRLFVKCLVYVTQNDLNFIFNVCPNIERLHLHCESNEVTKKVIVPASQKLKYLTCRHPWRPHPHDQPIKLELSRMSNLEILTIQGFNEIYDLIKVIMHDNEKFPNLHKVRIFGDWTNSAQRINQIARDENLNFWVERLRPT